MNNGKKNLLDEIEKPSIYKIYHMPREKTKVFWVLPNSYVNQLIEESLKSKKNKEFPDKIEKVFIFWKSLFFYE